MLIGLLSAIFQEQLKSCTSSLDVFLLFCFCWIICYRCDVTSDLFRWEKIDVSRWRLTSQMFIARPKRRLFGVSTKQTSPVWSIGQTDVIQGRSRHVVKFVSGDANYLIAVCSDIVTSSIGSYSITCSLAAFVILCANFKFLFVEIIVSFPYKYNKNRL